MSRTRQISITALVAFLTFVLPAEGPCAEARGASPLPQAATDAAVAQDDELPAQVQRALQVLASGEVDDEASETVGRYYCLVRGDWNRGVPFLAKCGNAALRAAAKRDLAGAATSTQQIGLADLWWELAKKEKPIVAGKLRARACYWYALAAPNVKGLSKRKCEKRLAESGHAMNAASENQPSASDHGRFGLEFDGQAWLDTDLTYDGSTPLTIEAWVTPAAFGTQSIVANCHGVGLALQVGEDGHWGFYVRDKTAYRGATSDQKVQLGKRVHLAGVFNDQIVRLFVNGRLQERTGKLTSGHKVSRFRFMIGADPDFHSRPQQQFRGIIDSVHVANEVIFEDNFTPADPPRQHPSSVLLLPLDEGEGDVAVDTSGHQRRAEIHGAKWK